MKKIVIDVIDRGEAGKWEQLDARRGEIIWEGEVEAEDIRQVNPWGKGGGKFRIIGAGMVKDFDGDFDFGEEGPDDVEEAVEIEEWDGCQWVVIRTNVWVTDFRE